MGADMKYPSNALEGFGSGALLDLRVRLAADFIKHSPMFAAALPVKADEDLVSVPIVVAGLALDLADELLSQAAARGWVEPLPADDGDLDTALRAQARRAASYQALQQMEAQKFVQDEQGRVVAQSLPIGMRPNGRAN